MPLPASNYILKKTILPIVARRLPLIVIIYLVKNYPLAFVAFVASHNELIFQPLSQILMGNCPLTLPKASFTSYLSCLRRFVSRLRDKNYSTVVRMILDKTE